MSSVRAVSKMTINGDGVRTISRAVPIPYGCTGGRLSIPNIDDNANITLEIGPEVDGYLWACDGIKRKDFPYSKDSNLKAYYVFEGNHSFDALRDETEIDNISYSLTTVRTQTFTRNGNPTKERNGGSYGISPHHGDGMAFDGTGDYLSLAYASGNAWDITTQDFTIMVTFQMEANAAAMVLGSKRAGTSSDGVGYEFGIDADGFAYITLEDADGSTTHTGNVALDDSALHKLFFHVDRDGNANLYMCSDYLSVTTPQAAATDMSGPEKTLLTASDAFHLGANNASTPASLFTGTIYELAIWHDLLTTDEILRYSQGGFKPVIDLADGQDLIVCASGYHPCTVDISEYIRGKQGAIRVRASAAQTTTPQELDFVFEFER
jgi:hypothetical protein